MERKGFTVMINTLSGAGLKETAEVFESVQGKIIERLAINDELNGGDGGLEMTFSDGTGAVLYDNGRSCCESRYMQTDDDLDFLKGGILKEIEIRDGPEEESEWGTHETQFLVIQTSKGDATMTTHNEHNGYYGGFWPVMQAWNPTQNRA